MTEILSVVIQTYGEKLKEDFEGIIFSLKGFEVRKFSNPVPCDVLILEIGEDIEKEFQNIQGIQASGEAKEIFLTSKSLDPSFLIRALKVGAREFFAQPIKGEEVQEALLKFRGRQNGMKAMKDGERKLGKIIDVIGSKGGVGTTTVAVNLATSLKESGTLSVALIDMNLLFGEIPTFLNIEPAFSWVEVARNISRLDSTYLMSILSKHPSGIYVLPSPSGLDGTNHVTAEIIEKILTQMQSVFDFVVIDGGQSVDEISLKILEMSDFVLPVVILSLPCLTNLKKLIWTFQKLGYPREERIKIVLNRHYKHSVISLKEAGEIIENRDFFWVIPNDYTTSMSAINQGVPLSSVARGAEISRSFKGIIPFFAERPEEVKEKMSFWRRKGDRR